MASKEGRAFVLNSLAEAEDSDEGAVFDNLLARVDDPALAKLVRRHRDDEQRHAALYRACLARVGVTPLALPPELRIIDRIDSILGGFSKKFDSGEAGVMEAYVLLQVIEERGVTQFALVADALEHVDPQSAAVIRTIIEDEKRHVRYAKAISRRYAPDDLTLERALARMRAAEKQAFEEHGKFFLSFVIAHRLLALPRPILAAWRWLSRPMGRSGGSKAVHSGTDASPRASAFSRQNA